MDADAEFIAAQGGSLSNASVYVGEVACRDFGANLGTGRSVRLGKISQTATGFSQEFTPAQASVQSGDIDMNLIISAQIQVKIYADLSTSAADVKFEYRNQAGSWIDFTPSSGLNWNSASFATFSIPSAGIDPDAAFRVTNESVAPDDFIYLREFRIEEQGCMTSLGTFCAPTTPNSELRVDNRRYHATNWFLLVLKGRPCV